MRLIQVFNRIIRMRFMNKRFNVFASLGMLLLLGGMNSAFAQQAVPWQMGFQEAATPVMERIIDLHNLLLWVTAGIVLFVTLL
ncbi:MAG TPA: hypothetical protein ENI69_04845, partial [Rhodospirillales bacterium]|nr:hypothetical protein [Rhodospirillales bacterium]